LGTRYFSRFAPEETLLTGQSATIACSSRDTIPIKSLKKWHHDPARALNVLAQLAHSRRSIFRNEINDGGFHALEIFTQQDQIGTHLDCFAGCNQKSNNLLRIPIDLDLFPRG